jgi:hypothetical protein
VIGDDGVLCDHQGGFGVGVGVVVKERMEMSDDQ